MDYAKMMKLLTGNVSTTIDQLAVKIGATPRTVYRYIETTGMQVSW